MNADFNPRGFLQGRGIGSTTTKAVVVRRGSEEVLWQDYARHDTAHLVELADLLEQRLNELGRRGWAAGHAVGRAVRIDLGDSR